MNRAPFVLGATAVGLGALLTYRTHPLTSTSLAKPVTAPAATTTTVPSSPATGATGSSPSSVSPSTTTPAVTARTVTGDDIQYRYGDIEVAATVKSGRITGVEIVRNDSPDPRSEQINSEAVPILEQQTVSAQSARIDGVSGATFTSEAYLQSLQSALDKAGS